MRTFIAMLCLNLPIHRRSSHGIWRRIIAECNDTFESLKYNFVLKKFNFNLFFHVKLMEKNKIIDHILQFIYIKDVCWKGNVKNKILSVLIEFVRYWQLNINPCYTLSYLIRLNYAFNLLLLIWLWVIRACLLVIELKNVTLRAYKRLVKTNKSLFSR
jgi:hypothetical protein